MDSRYLPRPQKFRGEINTNAAHSTPYWPELVVPPKGAPNILLIMTGDVGFSAPSTFGGVIPTPAIVARCVVADHTVFQIRHAVISVTQGWLFVAGGATICQLDFSQT
jgi:hypothetical protein